MEWSRLKAKFRKLFSSQSKTSTNDAPLSPEIGDAEEFTRFILNRKYFSIEKKRVKANALLPMNNECTARFETSTHRVKGLKGPEIWKLGYENVENAEKNRIIKARGQGPYSLVKAQKLSVDVNGPPYPRHADIIGWPPGKDDQLMIATEIADKLSLEMDPRT